MALTNVLVITNLYPYPWEPNRAAFNRQQFEHLAEIANVRIIVLVPWTSALRHLAELKTKTIKNVEVDYCIYLYTPKFGRSLYSLFIFLSLLPRFLTIQRFRPDCMLLSWAFPDAIAGTLLAKLLKVPTVIKTHGSDINVHAEFTERKLQVRWAMQRAKAIIAVSKDLHRKINGMDIPKAKIHTLYNGINKSIFFPVDKQAARASCVIDPYRKVVLFIGNLKVSKGCNLLLDAYLLMAKTDVDVDLFYIGGGDQLSVLKKIVVENALEKNVHFLGSIRHDLLRNWINASDVLALPSMNEGVPNVILEAQACGIPVVATNVGGIPEVVSSETGMLVEYGSAENLASALKEALCKNWDRDKISNGANILSWQENASKLLNIVKDAIH